MRSGGLLLSHREVAERAVSGEWWDPLSNKQASAEEGNKDSSIFSLSSGCLSACVSLAVSQSRRLCVKQIEFLAS